MTVGLLFRSFAASPPSASAQHAFQQAFAMWSNGQQASAEKMLAVDVQKYPQDQHLAFFKACCVRSRWDIRGAQNLMQNAEFLDPSSPEGLCAGYIMDVDTETDIIVSFNKLEKLADSNPSDVLILWTVAMECRQIERDYPGTSRAANACNLGAQLYGILLSRIHGVGSSLVHQTYGNLLYDMAAFLGNNKEMQAATVQHGLAVQLEPASWSCQALIADLNGLGETTKANAIKSKYAKYL